ncbi:STAS domain-containing protein [Streptomyces sp. NBC_00828]|uniref:STAS domain-containing protein n=1 Tax=Streptomyces sp. NBC_00828 TaxID=2903678 RepID=UPI003868B7A4
MPDSSPDRRRHGHREPLGRGNRLLHPFRHHRGVDSSDPDHVVVRLSGEITSANAEDIGNRLQDILRSGPAVLEVDLGRVTYFSNDAGTVFFMALRAAHGTRVVATHVGPRARHTLYQLGLVRAFEVYEGDGPGGS